MRVLDTGHITIFEQLFQIDIDKREAAQMDHFPQTFE